MKNFRFCCNRWLLIVSIIFFHHITINANEDSLIHIKTIPIYANLINIDETGNLYVVRNDNCLLRYNNTGDSTGFYRSILNGEIGSIDVTNPLRILLYYPLFTKIEILDRMLSLKNELNLPQANIVRPTAVAASADGNVWVYDQFNAKLKKIDEQLKVVNESNDLRQELQQSPTPVYMVERDRKLYCTDTTMGIYIFDQYASYVNLIMLPGVKRLQVFGNQFVYKNGNGVNAYNVNTIETSNISLGIDSNCKQAIIYDNLLYTLNTSCINIYKVVNY